MIIKYSFLRTWLCQAYTTSSFNLEGYFCIMKIRVKIIYVSDLTMRKMEKPFNTIPFKPISLFIQFFDFVAD